MGDYIQVKLKTKDGKVMKMTDREAREVVSKSSKVFTWKLRNMLDITYEEHKSMEDAIKSAVNNPGVEVINKLGVVQLVQEGEEVYYCDGSKVGVVHINK
jgi:hypothetical protein